MRVFIGLILMGLSLESFAVTKIRLDWQVPQALQGQIVQIWKHIDILKKNGPEVEFIGKTYGSAAQRVIVENFRAKGNIKLLTAPASDDYSLTFCDSAYHVLVTINSREKKNNLSKWPWRKGMHAS